MSSARALREFISERLTAAAEEIFTEFEKTIVQYEEVIDRQRRLLEISWKPQVYLHRRSEVPQQNVWKEEVLTDHQLSSDQEEPEPQQEEPEPPQIKEEQEECRIRQNEEQETEDTIYWASRPIRNQLYSQTEADQGGSSRDEDLNLTSGPRDHVDSPEHEKTHPDENLFSCEICANLTDQTHTGEIFTCHTCGKGFNHKRNLISHVRTHSGEKPFSCQSCGKNYSYKISLKMHTRTHTGEKPYSCEICGKCFSYSNQITDHMRTHTGEKPFTCQTCGKRFSQKRNLMAHMRTHTGEKPFSCQICGKSFSKNSNLITHVRTHTGEKPFPCLTCGKRFNHRVSLKSHMKSHTGEKL